MKIQAVNEDSFLITFGTKIDLSLTGKIASLNQQIKQSLAEHLIDSTPSYTTILVQFNLLTIAPLVVYKLLQTLSISPISTVINHTPTCHRLPVYYDKSVAPDLLTLAEQKGLSIEQVISIHSQQRYQVCALGFSPGFAFLAQVDPRIQQARLKTPRPNVQAGSVAIADKQTAVYPSDSPGGWNIIGHCPMRLFDMTNTPISDFKVGDDVEFYAVDEQRYLFLMEQQWGAVTESNAADLKRINQTRIQSSGTISKQVDPTLRTSYSGLLGLQVLNAGVLSSLQDRGRFGHSEQGVSQGGAVDAKSADWANYLLANSQECTVIEMTIGGAEFLAKSELFLALTGAEMKAQVLDSKNNIVQHVKQQSFKLLAGQRLKFGFSQLGVRAYLAVKGGFGATAILGSCSTVARNRVGGLLGNGQTLKKSDFIPVKPINATNQFEHRIPSRYHVKQATVTQIGLIESYQQDLFSVEQKRQLYQQVYTISTNSDRMGMRLSGEPLTLQQDGVISEAIALGSMQIPADGVPIILLQDRQTLGGYPKMGCVSRSDLHLLAQLPAHSKIQFYPIDLLTAQQQYREYLRFFNRDL